MRFAPAKFMQTLTPANLRVHLQNSPTSLHLSKDLIASWPALSSWTLSDDLRRLREVVGEERQVEIELGEKGKGYLDPSTQRISMGFGLFLDAFILSKIPSAGPTPSAYLAQSDILDVPAVLEDIPPLPHFSSGPQGTIYRRTMWIGPAGSFTPFHRDPYIGIYSQILGRKTFHVLPPDAAPLLDLSTDPLQRNTSTIPMSLRKLSDSRLDSEIHAATLKRYRENLGKAFQLQGACQADVGPGESLLVPEGWFHTAEGGDAPGIGVGAWFR